MEDVCVRKSECIAARNLKGTILSHQFKCVMREKHELWTKPGEKKKKKHTKNFTGTFRMTPEFI